MMIHEITEKAGARAKALLGWHFQREFIDMRRYTAHRLAIAVSDEELRSCMAEKRILSRVDQLQLFGTDLRYEMLEPIGKARPRSTNCLRPFLPLIGEMVSDCGDRETVTQRAPYCLTSKRVLDRRDSGRNPGKRFSRLHRATMPDWQ